MNHKTIYLVDAYALIYRAYYAFLRSPRINSQGLNTSATFGFVMTFVDMLARRRPDYVAVAFDTHGPTFRTELYQLYKANRDAQPEDISNAVPYIHRFLDAMNIKQLECPHYEADDIIGTLAARLSVDPDNDIWMLTPDKDYAQLVSGNVRMLKPTTQGIEEWDEQTVCRHFGITDTRQVIDLLGLWGDTADNIPGCPGVGQKRATELLATYGSIDGIYQHIDELKGKMRENFVNNREQVLLSRTLATIVTDAPVDFRLDDAQLRMPDTDKLRQLFDELEFRNVLKRIDALFAPQSTATPTLFDIPPEQTATPADDKILHTADTTEHEYIVISTDSELQQLADRMTASAQFCFDTETTSLDTNRAQIVGLSIALEAHRAYYIPFTDDQNEARRRLQILSAPFASPRILKIAQNLKYDTNVLANYDISIAPPTFDTMIAHFLLYPSARHNMDDMARQHLSYQPIAIETLIGKGSAQRSMRDVSIELIKEYAAEDADITLQLYQILAPKIAADAAVKHLFDTIEMPLVPVLASMERNGVRLDTDAMNLYADNLRSRIQQTEQEIKQLAGCDFNIASPKQVGEVLFERLHIDSSARKTRSGQYRTDEETLQKLAHEHPIVAQILAYRGLVKLLGTYAETLPKLADADGRIHTSYNQTIVVTGRLSSSNPNLQNIPIRDADGRQIRKAFVARDNEHVLVAADYSQVELRLMAHFSGDEHLISAFHRGDDIHAATAARIFGVDLSDVTTDMRRKAKTANFGIIYGISAFGLAERLDIPRKEARDIIDGYFDNFPAVKTYMDQCIDKAHRDGAVSTLFGRRRELPDINSRNAVVRGVAERNAINTPIQGTAADIIKIAMINIYNELQQRGLQTKMILQVHDELVFDTPRAELEVVKSIVKEKMETACQLSVPLVADVGVGSNWLEAH